MIDDANLFYKKFLLSNFEQWGSFFQEDKPLVQALDELTEFIE